MPDLGAAPGGQAREALEQFVMKTRRTSQAKGTRFCAWTGSRIRGGWWPPAGWEGGSVGDSFTTNKECTNAMNCKWVVACAYALLGRVTACGGLDNKCFCVSTDVSIKMKTWLPKEVCWLCTPTICQLAASPTLMCRFWRGLVALHRVLWNMESRQLLQCFLWACDWRALFGPGLRRLQHLFVGKMWQVGQAGSLLAVCAGSFKHKNLTSTVSDINLGGDAFVSGSTWCCVFAYSLLQGF